MNSDQELRTHLLELLHGGHAHADFDTAIKGFPFELAGKRIGQLPYTAWQLLEHLRIAQWDILEFSRDPKHVSPEWPRGYWPGEIAPTVKEEWEKSIAAFRADLRVMEQLVGDAETDLFARIPHGTGQTILREALLTADHNAYHLGQLVMLRRLLQVWDD